jgi:hypothetical protein
MPTYSWLTLQQADNALVGRLANTTFWTQPERFLYLNEALRLWNALTEQWNSDFVYTATTSWTNTGTEVGSPRLRTVTDVYLYTQMQYMLLEPGTGGTWAGTSQFSLAEFQFALQKRVSELIQATGCNMVNLAPLPSTPGTRRVNLPDTLLEPQRIRFIPAQGFGNNITMTREDTQAFQYFEPSYLQTFGMPESWSVSSEPPLAFDVDNAPNVAGAYDLVGLQTGPVFAPPSGSLLGIPDDFSMIAMYGALADLLSREAEATDRQRSAYCLKRFTDGIKIMQQSNWLLQASVNGFPVDTPGMYEMDAYSPEWQDSTTAFPTIVQGGMDFLNIAPNPGPGGAGFGGGGFGSGGFGGTGGATASATVTLLANAPLPTLLTDFVQVSRDVFDVVLSYAQRLAAFKMGGEDWNSTLPLEQDFMRAAATTNKRLLDIGIYPDILRNEGKREAELVPR